MENFESLDMWRIICILEELWKKLRVGTTRWTQTQSPRQKVSFPNPSNKVNLRSRSSLTEKIQIVGYFCLKIVQFFFSHGSPGRLKHCLFFSLQIRSWSSFKTSIPQPQGELATTICFLNFHWTWRKLEYCVWNKLKKLGVSKFLENIRAVLLWLWR